MAALVKYNDPVTGDRDPDPDAPVTPGWMMIHLLKDISAGNDRFKKLRMYVEGDPPRPDTPDAIKDEWIEFERFRQKSRTNFSSLVIAACLDKTAIQGFRTAAEGDEDGDKVADKIWDENDMAVKSDRAMFDMFTFGSGYLLADPISKRAQHFRPWQAGVITDVYGTSVAALTVHHNPVKRLDYAYLWMREEDENGVATGKVQCHIATRERENKIGRGTQFETQVPLGTYLPRNWFWWKTVDTELENIPVIEFENRDGFGEFEQHLDIVDRINHMILQRVVIVTMQAFRQRAIKGDLPKHDDKGNVIDWNKVFPAAPGSLWLTGPDSEIWESTPTDIQGILNGTTADVRDLSSVTRTPMTYFQPDAANGSAAGATLANDAYNSKIADRKMRNTGRWRLFMSLMFQITGDTERAKIDDIEVLWAPTESIALAERFSAAAQAAGFGIPLKTIMREIIQWNPKQMRAVEIERIAQSLTQAATSTAGGQETQTPLQKSRAAKETQAASNGSTTGGRA